MVGRSIAYYNLLECIGAGGLGAVYRARDTKVGRTVALKVLDAALIADETRRLALLDEARLAAKLSHPNIATLFEVGEADGVSYLAFEFVSGTPLRSEMAGRPVALRRALELCIQIADALADGHASSVLHGDLRPDTILVTPKGNAKLIDYGLWRWTRGGLIRRAAARAPEALPPEDTTIVSYMAPEQAVGGEMDGRGDVFSLGTILYELLTGTNPFAAATVSDAVLNVVTKTPPPPSTVNSDVPLDLDGVLAQALAKDLTRRFQSAIAMAAELRRVAGKLQTSAGSRADDFLLPVDDEADKVPVAIWVVAAAAIVIIAGFIWWAL